MSVMLQRWETNYFCATRHELALEPAIAALGHAYRFNHPVWAMSVFLDFYWPDLRVAVEVDGAWGHSTKADKAKDKERTAGLAKLGILVVRVTNGQVDTSPAKTARTARARAEKLRDANPLGDLASSPDVHFCRPRGVPRKGSKRRKGQARRRPRRGAGNRRPRRAGAQDARQGRTRGSSASALPVGPPVRPADPPYDPAGSAWGPVGILVGPVSPDFAPGRPPF